MIKTNINIMNISSNIYYIASEPKFYIPVILIFVILTIGNIYKSTIQQKMKTVLFKGYFIEIDM